MREKIISKIRTDYESIKITSDILTKHTLFIGSTGSGKTTSLNVLLRDLIRFEAKNEKLKLGLLIFDFKEDNTLFKIQKWGSECGRIEDVKDLSLGGNYYFEPFAELNCSQKISEYVELISNVLMSESHDNLYWAMAFRKRLNTILQYMFLTGERVDFANFVKHFNEFISAVFNNNKWIDKIDSAITATGELIRESSESESSIYKKILRIAESIKLDLLEWDRLDPRTKSNELSTMSNTLSVFNSPSTLEVFTYSAGKSLLNLSEICDSGKIVVATFSGTIDRFSSILIAKLLKAQFYKSIQFRSDFNIKTERLVGLIMDEFPLVATTGNDLFSDSFNLQTIRSKGGFIVAATQGLIGLDLALGRPSRLYLISNFNNYFIFRSNETEVQNFAENINFQREESSQMGFLADTQERKETAFNNLEDFPTGYAIIKLANGWSSSRALKLQRLFVKTPQIGKKAENRDILGAYFEKVQKRIFENDSRNKSFEEPKF